MKAIMILLLGLLFVACSSDVVTEEVVVADTDYFHECSGRYILFEDKDFFDELYNCTEGVDIQCEFC